jgi:hypothetical protein
MSTKRAVKSDIELVVLGALIFGGLVGMEDPG